MDVIERVLWFFGILVGIASLEYFISKRKEDKRRKIDTNNSRERFLEQKEEIIRLAKEYKEKNKEWNVMPELSKIKIVYAFGYINVEGEKRYSYFEFSPQITIKGVIFIDYEVSIPSKIFTGQKFLKDKYEVTEVTFNKTWFTSIELANERLLEEMKTHPDLNPNIVRLTEGYNKRIGV